MTTVRQIPLSLPHEVSYDLSDFIVSRSNEEAFRFVQDYQQWPHHIIALVGPAASGKTHLARGWATEVGAKILPHDNPVSGLEPGGVYVLEDVNQRDADGNFLCADTWLFHLFNWSREVGAKILMTSDSAPNTWGRSLPDLRSRLGLMPVSTIDEPDDELLLVLLIKLFSDKQLQVNISVIHYLVARMERSFESARMLVNLLDQAALAQKSKVTKALAKICLESL
jgi:chromosomal replication initiation ATPase DnaA